MKILKAICYLILASPIIAGITILGYYWIKAYRKAKIENKRLKAKL